MPSFFRKVFNVLRRPGDGKLLEAVGWIKRALGLGANAAPAQQPVEAPDRAPVHVAAQSAAESAVASFTEQIFRFGDADYRYRVYFPATGHQDNRASLPLVVLLHGCKQDATDFALGTAMNALADHDKCVVLYPEQRPAVNPMRCWSWYDTAHQRRGAGEPGMIAALTRQVLHAHSADPARIYIAGLSAGGAMAALVARLYPELFAAVGVHSGLPAGAATNLISAMSAMRQGSHRTAFIGEPGNRLPTIVFHGDADATVHPDNGEKIVSAALAAWDAAGLALTKLERCEGEVATHSDTPNRSTRRTTYSGTDGKPYVDYWAIGAGPHAWSGGNLAGSFTDPQGPGASRAMLAFFLQHRHPAHASRMAQTGAAASPV